MSPAASRPDLYTAKSLGVGRDPQKFEVPGIFLDDMKDAWGLFTPTSPNVYFTVLGLPAIVVSRYPVEI
jgi:hypothetical protein